MAAQHQEKRLRLTASDVILALDNPDIDIEDFDDDNASPMMPGSDDELDDIQWEEGIEEEREDDECQGTDSLIPHSSTSNTPLTTTPLGSPPSGFLDTSYTGSQTTPVVPHPGSEIPLPTRTTHSPSAHPQWKSSLHSITVAPFSEAVGPTFSVPSVPKDIFSHFLTDSICEVIGTQSNSTPRVQRFS